MFNRFHIPQIIYKFFTHLYCMPLICQLLRFRKIRNLVSIFSYIGLFNLHKDKNPNTDRVKIYLKICLSLIRCSKSIFRLEPRFLHHKIWKYNIIELFLLHQWKKLRLDLENWQILNCNLQVAELICLINLTNPYQAPTLCLNCACLRQWNYLLSPLHWTLTPEYVVLRQWVWLTNCFILFSHLYS